MDKLELKIYSMWCRIVGLARDSREFLVGLTNKKEKEMEKKLELKKKELVRCLRGFGMDVVSMYESLLNSEEELVKERGVDGVVREYPCGIQVEVNALDFDRGEEFLEDIKDKRGDIVSEGMVAFLVFRSEEDKGVWESMGCKMEL